MKIKKCYKTHKHCNGPSCNYDKSAVKIRCPHCGVYAFNGRECFDCGYGSRNPTHDGPVYSLSPAQRRLSAHNNSREAFEQVNGGKLPTEQDWLVAALKQSMDGLDQVEMSIRHANQARERLALKPWERK